MVCLSAIVSRFYPLRTLLPWGVACAVTLTLVLGGGPVAGLVVFFLGLGIFILAGRRRPPPNAADMLASAVPSLPEPMAIVDRQGTLVWANRAFLAIAGDEALGSRIEQCQGLSEHFDYNAWGLEEIQQREGWVTGSDRRQHLLETRIVPLSEGRGWIVASHDATRRRQQEEEAHHANAVTEEKEAILRNLLDSLPDLVFLKGRDGRYLLVNQAFCQMVGKPREEIIGRSEEDFFDRDPGARDIEESIFTIGDAKEQEDRFPLPNGPSPCYAILRTPLRNPAGKTTGLIGIARDITYRKTCEEKIRESEERYELAVSGAMDGLWDWDIRTGSVYLSPRWKEIAGYACDDVPNTYDTFRRVIHPEHRESFETALRQYLNQRTEATFRAEYRLLHRDGSHRWVMCRGRAIRRQDGQAYRMAGSLTDITERKHNEQRLQQAHDEAADLNRRLASANERLEKAVLHAESMAKEAERANQAKSDFLAHVSHDMRTPLNAIIGYLPLLQNVQPDETSRDYIDSLGESAESLLDLVNDLLDLAKIEAGRFTLDDKPFDASRAVRSVGHALMPQAKAKGLDLKIMIGEKFPEAIHGDPKRLNQILFNLIGNAVKFTEQGEVEVSAWAEEIIEPPCTSPGDISQRRAFRLFFSIRDTGPGIAEEQLSKLFTPFEQIGDIQNQTQPGTGLGLTISRQLAHLMGGDIRVESRYGSGSTFTLWFDTLSARMEKPSPKASRREQAFDFAARHPLRILVVDDSMVNREVLLATLAEMGYQAEAAESGEEALERQQAAPADLIFMDFRMPGLNGYETTQQLREWEKTENHPAAYVCLLTADAFRLQSEEDATLIDDQMTKPLNGERLREVLRSAHTHRVEATKAS